MCEQFHLPWVLTCSLTNLSTLTMRLGISYLQTCNLGSGSYYCNIMLFHAGLINICRLLIPIWWCQNPWTWTFVQKKGWVITRSINQLFKRFFWDGSFVQECRIIHWREKILFLYLDHLVLDIIRYNWNVVLAHPFDTWKKPYEANVNSWEQT
jgi:hypothetical protein